MADIDQTGVTVSEQQKLVDELIFKRDVNEGFILIDFISGRSEKSLKDLDTSNMVLPAGQGGGDGGKISTGDALRAFCEMRYPPAGENGIKAGNAAFVLELKDRLNALASPARGVTIAYTAIFVGYAMTFLSRRSAEKQSLVDQASEAFPSIAGHARKFGRFFGLVLPAFLGLWFLITAFTYWDVGYGGTITQRIQQLDTQRMALLQDMTQANAKQRLADIQSEVDDARKTLNAFHTAVTGDHSWYNLFAYVRPLRWGFLAYWPNGQPAGDLVSLDRSVIWVVSLYGNYVLPAMFGLLGTMASIIRVVQAKVRDSLLSPRDFSLSLLGLLTGPLAGLAVGLFYTPSVNASPGATSLAGTVTLTVSGLGFLAGYGSDAFFKFLDALLARVFALEKTS
jgi:hypothetical protein